METIGVEYKNYSNTHAMLITTFKRFGIIRSYTSISSRYGYGYDIVIVLPTKGI